MSSGLSVDPLGCLDFEYQSVGVLPRAHEALECRHLVDGGRQALLERSHAQDLQRLLNRHLAFAFDVVSHHHHQPPHHCSDRVETVSDSHLLHMGVADVADDGDVDDSSWTTVDDYCA